MVFVVLNPQDRTVSFWIGRRQVQGPTRDMGAVLAALGPPTDTVEAWASFLYRWLTRSSA